MKDANIQGWFEPVRDERGLKGDELIKWAVKYFNLAGWGKLTFEASQITQGRALFRIEDSPIATDYLSKFGKSKFPVCHLHRGGLAAGGEFITGQPSEVIETKCVAQGHPHCEIVLRPRIELLKKEYSEFKKQIE
jgi:hypothetical protein